jgi:hypothetical protein
MPLSDLTIGGALIFWSLAEWTDRALLQAGLARVGMAGYVPDPRQPCAALREALDEVLGGPRVLVRPLKKRDGFTVVREERGESANTYKQELVARVAANGSGPTLRFDPTDERAEPVRTAFENQLGLLHAGQVSTMLVAIAEGLSSTCLRPSGGLYWLPPHRLDEFQQAASAVEAAGQGKPSAVYILRHPMDADAIRAIHDAIVNEVQSESKRLHDEVVKGELGSRALKTRRDQAAALKSKVALYEEVLDVGLAGLHVAVDQADQAAAAAILIASAHPEPEEAAAAG